MWGDHMAIEERTTSQVWDAAPSTRVLVIDDHVVFAELLGLALSGEDGFEFVGRADGVTAGIRMVESLLPDIVVMDVRLGDGDGVAATAELTRQFPRMCVVVLTGFVDTGLIQRVADAGASALLPKDGELHEMVRALRTARRGRFVVHPALARLFSSGDLKVVDDLAPLEGHELELLRLLAAGFDITGIAHELAMTTELVREQVATLLTKLGASSAFDAVVIAMRNGLLHDAAYE